ncbi:MAG: hypothetical protein ACRDHO_03640 [Actinomycetota bacterium]
MVIRRRFFNGTGQPRRQEYFIRARVAASMTWTVAYHPIGWISDEGSLEDGVGVGLGDRSGRELRGLSDLGDRTAAAAAGGLVPVNGSLVPELSYPQAADRIATRIAAANIRFIGYPLGSSSPISGILEEPGNASFTSG